MTASRDLGYSETYMHLLQSMICGNAQIVCAVRLRGPLTPGIFLQGLKCLCERQPVLRARILKREKYRFDLSVDLDNVPVKVLPREGGDHWQKVVDSMMATVIPADRYVWAVTLLHGGEGPKARHEVVMALNHAAADGILPPLHVRGSHGHPGRPVGDGLRPAAPFLSSLSIISCQPPGPGPGTAAASGDASARSPDLGRVPGQQDRRSGGSR